MVIGFGIGPAELIVIGLWLVCLALPIWGIVDAARRPQSQWMKADQNQTMWVVLMAVGIFFCPLGVIAAIIYLAAIRPKPSGVSSYSAIWLPSSSSSAANTVTWPLFRSSCTRACSTAPEEMRQATRRQPAPRDAAKTPISTPSSNSAHRCGKRIVRPSSIWMARIGTPGG